MSDHALVHLDNNSTTTVLPDVFEATPPYFAQRFGNPSSIHFMVAAGELSRR